MSKGFEITVNRLFSFLVVTTLMDGKRVNATLTKAPYGERLDQGKVPGQFVYRFNAGMPDFISAELQVDQPGEYQGKLYSRQRLLTSLSWDHSITLEIGSNSRYVGSVQRAVARVDRIKPNLLAFPFTLDYEGKNLKGTAYTKGDEYSLALAFDDPSFEGTDTQRAFIGNALFDVSFFDTLRWNLSKPAQFVDPRPGEPQVAHTSSAVANLSLKDGRVHQLLTGWGWYSRRITFDEFVVTRPGREIPLSIRTTALYPPDKSDYWIENSLHMVDGVHYPKSRHLFGTMGSRPVNRKVTFGRPYAWNGMPIIGRAPRRSSR